MCSLAKMSRSISYDRFGAWFYGTFPSLGSHFVFCRVFRQSMLDSRIICTGSAVQCIAPSLAGLVAEFLVLRTFRTDSMTFSPHDTVPFFHRAYRVNTSHKTVSFYNFRIRSRRCHNIHLIILVCSFALPIIGFNSQILIYFPKQQPKTYISLHRVRCDDRRNICT